MALKKRKRDLRTRVSPAVHDLVKAFARSKDVSTYEATERLVLMGLESLKSTPEERLVAVVENLSARVDEIRKLVDRGAFGAFVSYAYARSAALGALAGEAREKQDQKILSVGRAAFNNQINKVFE